MVRSLRLAGEYFFGTETSRWYRNQRIVAREHSLDRERLKEYISILRFQQTIYIGVGKVFPNLLLANAIYNFSNLDYWGLALGGEIIREVTNRLFKLDRKPFLQTRYSRHEEPESWKPEDGEGWRVNKPKSWEDEGEEWKNG